MQAAIASAHSLFYKEPVHPGLQAVDCRGDPSSMGDDNFRPALNQGFAYDGAILKGGQTRRRLAMGRDAALESEPDEERDPEGPVTDYDELVRYLSLRSGLFVTRDSTCWG